MIFPSLFCARENGVLASWVRCGVDDLAAREGGCLGEQAEQQERRGRASLPLSLSLSAPFLLSLIILFFSIFCFLRERI